MQTTLDKKSRVTSIIFLVSIITVTVLLFCFTFYMVSCSPFAVKEFDDIHKVDIDDYTSIEDGEYYVFVYNTESEKHEQLVDFVIQYAEYERTNFSAKNIYILNYEDNKDITGKGHMDIGTAETTIKKSIPALLLIKDGKISETKTTVSTIKTTLYNEME